MVEHAGLELGGPAALARAVLAGQQPSWSFLLTPTLIGATILVAVAVLYNNQGKSRSYPKYWF